MLLLLLLLSVVSHLRLSGGVDPHRQRGSYAARCPPERGSTAAQRQQQQQEEGQQQVQQQRVSRQQQSTVSSSCCNSRNNIDDNNSSSSSSSSTMVLSGSEDGRVFIRGLRLDHASSGSFGHQDLRSGVQLPAHDSLPLTAAGDHSSSSSTAAAAAQEQQQESLGIHDASESLLVPAEGLAPADASAPAATAAAAAAGAAAVAADAGVPGASSLVVGGGFSFLEVLNSEEVCSLPSEGVSLQFRALLSVVALLLLALKMLLLKDRASRPKKLLLLDFLKTAAACTLLQLLPPSEGALVGDSKGSDPNACETYAAVQLIQALLWLTILELLLRKMEHLLGCRQGGYLRCSSSSRCCCCCSSRTDSDETAAAATATAAPKAAGAAKRGQLLQQGVRRVKRFLASPPEVSWVKYGQELVALLLCVAAAQAATALLLLLLVSRLSPLFKLVLSLLHGDNVTLRRLIVGFFCPLFTDLLQSCSLDKLIRTQPKPCCQRSSSSSSSSSSGSGSNCSSSRCRVRREEEEAFLSD
ncbi:hypothetical protein Emed_001222 [Eimeria media]